MATELSTKYLTILDWAKRVLPDGGIAEVIEQIAETNPLMADASMIEGNLPTGHRSTQRTTQPSGTWRQYNQGVAETKSTTRQVDDQAGMLEAYSAVDAALARLNGNVNAFRASEDAAFIFGLGEDATDAIIYGNSGVNPEQPHGLARRYNSLTDTVGAAGNVINAGGSGSDNASMWLITWGAKTTTLIHPKGTPMGLQATDLGEIPWDDASSNKYQALVTHYKWDLGLSVPDYRYNVRIANIDISELTADGATGADLMFRMVSAFYARPTVALSSMTRTFWYCNKTIGEYLHHQASNKSNVNLTIDNPAGMPIVSFLGAPVHIVDALTSAEATIS